jgi:hypothetical protein
MKEKEQKDRTKESIKNRGGERKTDIQRRRKREKKERRENEKM